MASSARAGSPVGGFWVGAAAWRGAVDSSGLADFDWASFGEGAGAWSSGSSGGWTAGGDFRCCVESPSSKTRLTWVVREGVGSCASGASTCAPATPSI